MTITFSCVKTGLFSFHYKELAKRVIRHILTTEGFPCEAEVFVMITDDKGIRSINLSERGIDASTDVLSFPLAEYDSPKDWGRIQQEPVRYINPETGEVMLGDIVLSYEHVFVQANRYGHTPRREYAFLITHSMLHLLGYDHELPDEQYLMEMRQDAILKELKIPR